VLQYENVYMRLPAEWIDPDSLPSRL
jgi:hypothetical protein